MDKAFGRRQREVVDLLLKHGLISKEQLDEARLETKTSGLRIDVALKKLNYITDEDIEKARAAELNLPYMDLMDYTIDPETIKLLPESLVTQFNAVPLFRIQNSLTVGMVDPHDIEAIDQIRNVSKIEVIEPVLVSEKSIQRVLHTYYGDADSVSNIVESFDNAKIDQASVGGAETVAEEAPVIKLVNILIDQSVDARASDIHIEPEENSLRVRARVDGLLREISVIPKKLQNAVTSRIKVLAQLDIAETRKPQDGRFRLTVKSKEIDLRVSTFPTVYGENVVMRILDRSAVLMGFNNIGLYDDDLKTFEEIINRPNGIILVTGPTGSGKTSTLYASLNKITSMEKNIITIEDPVEYELSLIRQTQVNPKADITFANGLRYILRQDPDVIMVGEIRDKETAEVAIQAALTGHLVFSTLHTNDAPAALTRLIDMGIEPFLIASSIIGILAQRLVRVICQKCKALHPPPEGVLQEFGIAADTKIYQGKGCDYCQQTGYDGRMAIFELLTMNQELRKLVDERRPAGELKKTAISTGMKTLRQDGLLKVQEGKTTLEEVLRVTTSEG